MVATNEYSFFVGSGRQPFVEATKFVRTHLWRKTSVEHECIAAMKKNIPTGQIQQVMPFMGIRNGDYSDHSIFLWQLGRM
tara:strand:- start:270 stop:509 length:240 start_codon:yes stop_codon:yes gene_type:complete